MNAIGNQKEALAQSIAGLPDFMRNFNTTAVNLRATLDDLDPLVDASKPVATRLGPVLRRAARRDRGRGADDPRPRRDHQAPQAQQRPRRPHEAPGAARGDRGRPLPRQRRRPPRRLPRVHPVARGLAAAAPVLPRLHARARRLVQRLRLLGRLRRQRRHRALLGAAQRLLVLAARQPAERRSRRRPACHRRSTSSPASRPTRRARRCSTRSTPATSSAARAPTSATRATTRPRSPTAAPSTAIRPRCPRARRCAACC